MALDSNEIRREITNILRKNVRVRGKELADQVIDRGFGSQKTVYREIQNMCDEGILIRTEINRAKVEYELRELSEAIEKRLEFYAYILDEIYDALTEFENEMEEKKSEMFYLHRLFGIAKRIKQLQKIETTFRILDAIQHMNKSRHFTRQKKKVEKLWKFINKLIAKQPEEKFIYELFVNFKPISIQKANSYPTPTKNKKLFTHTARK